MTLAIALVVLAGAAASAPWLAGRLGRSAGYPLALVFAGVGAALLTYAPKVITGAAVTQSLPWVPALGVDFRLHLDGLSLLFVILILGVGALIMAYCARYLDQGQPHRRLYGLLTLFATAMLGLVLAGDLITFFAFWELTTFCSFFLIGGAGLSGAKAATRALIVTGSGGLALFAAFVLIAVTTGTTDMTAILDDRSTIRDSALAPAIAICLMLAAFTKSAQLPFHFWLPDAMVAITPVSAYLHAATMVKAGIYLLLRFSPPFADKPLWTITLMSVGLLTAVMGALFALQKHDLKAVLAYSTVSQLGFLVALVGVGTPAALAAAALHTFAHALFKATLFMLVGIIDREAGSRDIRELSGLWRVMPITAALTGVAALSMAGLPPLIGFVSKEEAFYAFLGAEGPAWVGIVAAGTAVTAAALTFAYSFRILVGAFGGRTRQPDLYEPHWAFLAPAAVTAVLSLALGIWAGALNPLINRTVLDTRLQEGTFDLALWHGFTAALALSMATVTIGTLLFVFRDRVDAVLARLKLPWTGAQVYDRSYDRVLQVGAFVGRPSMSPRLAAHLIWPLLGLGALAAVGLPTLDLDPYPADVTRPGDWVLIALLACSVAALVTTHSRLGALALLGVVGFVVAAWFVVIGGPDLALTQLLVEVLTVVVAVLVLRHLPTEFVAESRRRAVGAGLVATAAGVVAFAATLALTGRREPSPASQFLLAESEDLTGGTNVVNTVLVDFRGLDTWGEITVLAVAALGLLALLDRDTPAGPPPKAGLPNPLSPARGNTVIMTTTRRLLLPVALAFSAYLLVRGHGAPGGGFIAGLVGGLAIALAQLPHQVPRRPRLLNPALLAAGGVALATVVGLLGYVDGAFLRPLQSEFDVFGATIKLTSSLLFDVGVYLVVVGLVAAAIDRLARGQVRAPVLPPPADGPVPPAPSSLEETAS